jgi:large subunit ribosomal protein L10
MCGLFCGINVKKEQKAKLIDEIAEQIDSADAIYAVDYRGLSVPQAASLRDNLREANASFRIVKNTLTARAADQSGVATADDIKGFVDDGPTALTFINGDPAAAAKAIDSFSKQFKVLDFKGGTLGDQILTADDIRGIAKLPSRDRLNAQLAGIVASPLTTLVRGLGSMVSGLAIALGQLAEQKTSEEPAQASAPEQAPAETPDETPEETPDETPAATPEAAGESEPADSRQETDSETGADEAEQEEQ